MRKSSDPKYQHLNDDLHVEITAFAPPSEAHARIAYALTEASLYIIKSQRIFSLESIALQVRKYLIPDSNDEIRQEQMRIATTLPMAGHRKGRGHCLVHQWLLFGGAASTNSEV